MSKFKIIYMVICLVLVAGCSSLRTQDSVSKVSSPKLIETEASSADIRSELQRPYRSPFGDVPLTDNKHSRKWVKYFLGRGRHHMDRYLARSSRYIPMMKKVLREEGLPEELVYVALIESGFSPKAHSRANAVGYWQFIRSTGKGYGLRIDGYVDERRDPVLSTRAAAAYFKALYNLFGSWHLSLAAYNTGENRVKNRIMRYYTRDFWELSRRRKLPRETRNYVPKFIAATKIAQNPESYGFNRISYQPPLEYDAVEAKNPISLKKLAQTLNVDVKEMARLNPKFRGDYVPNYSGHKVMIRVPKGMGTMALNAIPSVKISKPKFVYRDHFYYRVRRGDTLGHIARRHRTSVGTLRRLNRMGRRSFLRVGQRLKVPERGGGKYVKNSQRIKKSRSVDKNAVYHTVRRGENLSLIAKKYGVSINKLKQMNRLGRRALIRVGQRIRLRESSENSRKSIGAGGTHTVRRGENLSLIAQKYGVQVYQLKKWNQLGRRSIIRVGQRIKVRGRNFHVVKRGENLTLIANKYKVPLRKLVRANKLKKSLVIAAGQKLTIPR